jgi:hypothetical protein
MEKLANTLLGIGTVIVGTTVFFKGFTYTVDGG